MTAIKRVALIGASGKIGPSILEAFLVNGNFDVTVLSRKSSGATFPSGVKIIKTDVDYDSLRAAFSGQDAVVSIVGGAQASNQKLYIDAAIAAGVKRFIPSDFGGWTPDAAILDKNKLFKSKVEIAEYLKEKESETFSWSAIINGPVFDWSMKVGFLGFDVKSKTAEIWDDGEARFSSATLSTISKATVRVLEPAYIEQTRNRDIFILSHTTSQNQILAIFEKLTGTKWTVDRVDSKPLIADLHKKLAAGDFGPQVVYGLIKAATFAGDAGNPGDYSKLSWNETLHVELEDLETVLGNILKEVST